MLKYTKMSLRIWIAMGSVVGFLGGWALLAHSPKPAQPVQSTTPLIEITPLPTLAPFPSFNNARGSGFAGLPSVSQSGGFLPRLRTGGS